MAWPRFEQDGPNPISDDHELTRSYTTSFSLTITTMTSYLASWLWSGGAVAPASSTAKTQPASTDGQASELDVPTLQTISPQASDDEGSDTEREDNEEDDDVAPAFPALNSAQRASTSTGNSRPAPSNSNSSSLSILTDSQRMPPPPLPNLASRTPGVPHARSAGAGSLSLAPPPAPGGGSLAVPLTTTKAPVNLKKPKRQKVALAPGHGALDWANLKSSGADLRVRLLSLARCLAH